MEKKSNSSNRDPYAALQVVVARMVWDDESLREKIKDNPKETIEHLLEIKLPDDLVINVIDETEPKTFHLRLPYHPREILGHELTSDQLDRIAGGMTTPFYNEPEQLESKFGIQVEDPARPIEGPASKGPSEDLNTLKNFFRTEGY